MFENADRGTHFGDMSFLGKIKWTLKLLVALATFGFVFPNLMHD
jgi:hypothetical protein